ncbi:HAD-like protein [Rickenella mellea]|uniref:Mitochondrial import inner membrane translocase subunit TIM50 n=1 Tax=Rickenella mellea TaxID=50990 RepID=A0A4Y7Q673_9AGAM|nr:HAD-like protein [Rickenella mellea]
MQSVLLTRLPFRRANFILTARYLATKPPNSPPNHAKPIEPTPEPPTPPEPTPDASSPSSLSLDFSPEEKQTRTGAKSSKQSLSSIERKRRVMGRVTLAMLGLGLLGGGFYLGRQWDEEELKERKMTLNSAPSTRWGRTKSRFSDLFDFFSKPQWQELLPPPVPPFQKPYTLLLSIDDLLVTSTWDRQHGWRTAKRPGVDYFLAYMAQFYEIVVFTSQYYYTALPVLEKLDPYNYFITYKLFRESTRSINGQIVKDLSYLNRDLSKVIMMDTNPEHISANPENAVIMPKWKGDPKDKGLVAMIPFLESIAFYKPQDVRPILTAYQGKDIPLEYAKTEAEGKRNFLEEWRKSGKAPSSTSFTLSGLFGGSNVRLFISDSKSSEPLTYLEQKRKEAQLQYLEEMKYLEENKPHLDKLIEEDRQAQAAQMSGNLLSVISGIASGKPPAPPEKPDDKSEEPKSSSSKPIS